MLAFGDLEVRGYFNPLAFSGCYKSGDVSKEEQKMRGLSTAGNKRDSTAPYGLESLFIAIW